MTTATVVLRRGELDFFAVTFEREGGRDERATSVDDSDWAGGAPLPLTRGEQRQVDRALDDAEAEDRAAELEDMRESFWECRPYVLEVCP